ncbi:hypothetical protein DPMN_083450 [Dreissena polymorpha]|uniref:Uncharacterized protein n=1 Tax=Dreissena polymorpha TaxID=45954 RepID=A0A9D3YCV4_DREPO|nr:hypothetical protein DPMN_083450 [Dreissena polymorpha]
MLRRVLYNLQLEHDINRMQHEIDETSRILDMLASTPFKTDIERGRPEVYLSRDSIKSEKKISSAMLGSSPKRRRLLPKTPVVGASRMDIVCQTEQIKDLIDLLPSGNLNHICQTGNQPVKHQRTSPQLLQRMG